jgi:hypothetical protein
MCWDNVEIYWTDCNLPAQALSELYTAVTCDAFDRAFAVWDHHSVAALRSRVILYGFNADKTAAGELIDGMAVTTVKVKGQTEPFSLGSFTPWHDRCVVAANLCTACAFRRSPVELVNDDRLQRASTTAQVRVDRRHKYAEQVVFGRGKGKTAAAEAEDDGTNVESCRAVVRGNKLCIRCDGSEGAL